jgi:amino acid transporter
MLDNKITNLLEGLANKLGTTTDHLWNVLMHQAHIEAFKNIATIVFFIIADTLMFKYAFKHNKDKNLKNTKGDFESIAMLLFVVILVFIIVITVNLLPETIDAIFNPEYWALHNILKSIR